MECVGISSQSGEQVPSQAPHPPEGVCKRAMPVSVPSVFPNLYIAPSQFWVDGVQMRFLRSFVCLTHGAFADSAPGPDLA